VTTMAIVGRSLLGWAMPLRADRRLVACAGYAARLAGSIVFIGAAGTNVPLLLLGVLLFGAGFGNATSLPTRAVCGRLDCWHRPRCLCIRAGRLWSGEGNSSGRDRRGRAGRL